MSTGTVGEVGNTGEARARIAAPARTVWALVADVTRMGEWSPETTSCGWIDGATGPAVGARFRGHNKRGWSKWTTTCEVTACEPGREFSFVVGGGDDPQTVWSYVFVPLKGGVEVRESFELIAPLTGLDRALTRVLARVKDREADLEDQMRRTLARLKEASEASSRAGSPPAGRPRA